MEAEKNSENANKKVAKREGEKTEDGKKSTGSARSEKIILKISIKDSNEEETDDLVNLNGDDNEQHHEEEDSLEINSSLSQSIESLTEDKEKEGEVQQTESEEKKTSTTSSSISESEKDKSDKTSKSHEEIHTKESKSIAGILKKSNLDEELNEKMNTEKLAFTDHELTEYFDNLDLNPYEKLNDTESFLSKHINKYLNQSKPKEEKKQRVENTTTYLRQINTKPKIQGKKRSLNEKKKDCKYESEFDDYNFVLNITKDLRIEKESLYEYVTKKRDMFLLHYLVGVKKQEMNKLERLVLEEEKKLEQAEMFLEEDAIMFDEFIKWNDRTASDSIKSAELQKKTRQEKDSELRALNNQIILIKADITKCEEQLKEYLIYEKFLKSLTPPEWLEKKKQEKKEKKEKRTRKNSLLKVIKGSKKVEDKNPGEEENETLVEQLDDEDEYDDEDDEIYFKNPEQLLDIFSEMEEQNLSLIQNSQETEEALEEQKQAFQATKDKLEKETTGLKNEIEFLKTNIKKEQQNVDNLAQRARTYMKGEVKSEEDLSLEKLHKVTLEAYKSIFGDMEINLTSFFLTQWKTN